MVARPATRHPAAPTATRAMAPANPRVRDFSGSASSFAMTWDVRTIYDFLFSLNDDKDFPHDLLDVDRAWLAEARAATRARRDPRRSPGSRARRRRGHA